MSRYRYRSVVHDEWGLPLYPSPGVVTLFSGPSGTGKTTTAEVIAHDLGVDMFRVDLSALVSKYIGETEKNLEEIFSAAHAGDYLLLFDEADSLFGTRSKVTDARDRYANMEVSYLLQRLETYDGFVVLTSNFQGNIDQAFLRRIHVTVHFAVPSVEDRVRIWERSLGGAPARRSRPRVRRRQVRSHRRLDPQRGADSGVLRGERWAQDHHDRHVAGDHPGDDQAGTSAERRPVRPVARRVQRLSCAHRGEGHSSGSKSAWVASKRAASSSYAVPVQTAATNSP